MTQPPLARRLLLVAVAASLAFVGRSLTANPAQLAAPARAAELRPARDKDAYDLSQLELFRKVVVYIKDNYVDPQRIDPKEMFLSALESIEKGTAEVMVQGDAKEGRVKVTCGGATRDFEFKDVESIWMIPHRIRPVFSFIQDNLVTTENRRDIEYAAINGMLTTLDPHSWLLKPDLYKEMKLQTKGEFGGLGFVISMDEERLTVKKVLKNTPASRAGIRKGDHIARIAEESTINMDLNEAVSKLRGKPGTEVNIWVRRGGKDGGREEEKAYTLVRATISIESVTSQLLPEGVGYVRLASFAGTTSRDLAASIRELREQAGGRLKGLVLDLRSNPGGLLEQAIQVADQFIEEGTIVTTASQIDRMREEKRAHKDGGEKDFPIAVLVNSESASASEIVAGALKNLNRAVIIGRQTFGKGSVQVLYDLPESGASKEESALKLTIAQYLTPGDQSIQEIGVTPDIELVPARVTKDRVDLFAPPRSLREADLEHHFLNGFASAETKAERKEPEEKPAETLRYLREDKPRKDKDKGDAHDDDELVAVEEPDEENIPRDFQVLFARDLVLRAPRTDRAGMLQAARAFLADKRAEEEAKIEKAMTSLGLDWSAAKKPPQGPASATVDFRTTPARGVPGEPFALALTVRNTGRLPFERLRAWTRCEAEKTEALCALLDRREFLFGRVGPGEERTWTAPVKLPAHVPATHEVLTLHFAEAHGNAPEEQKVAVDVAELPRPAFAWTYQVMDRNGLAEPGETIDVQVDVRNTGSGKSSKNTYVSLRNSQNDKIFMKRGRVSVGEIRPGETRTATLSLEVRPGAETRDGIPLKLEIGDRDMWEFQTGKIALPAAAGAPAWAEESGVVRVGHDAALLAAPQQGAPLVAEARKGAVLPVAARVGDFWKVEWGKGRPGYLALSAAQHDRGGKPPRDAKDPLVQAVMHRDPPVIAFQGVETAKSAVVVDGEKFKLSGQASDGGGLLDVRVFVDNQKVFFRTARAGEEAAAGAQARKLPFTAEFPLKPGNNMVLVVAREDEEFSTQRTLIVHRRAPALAERKGGASAPAPANP